MAFAAEFHGLFLLESFAGRLYHLFTARFMAALILVLAHPLLIKTCVSLLSSVCRFSTRSSGDARIGCRR